MLLYCCFDKQERDELQPLMTKTPEASVLSCKANGCSFEPILAGIVQTEIPVSSGMRGIILRAGLVLGLGLELGLDTEVADEDDVGWLLVDVPPLELELELSRLLWNLPVS